MTRKVLVATDFRDDVTIEGEANFLGQTYFLGSVTEASTLLVDGAAEFDGTVLLHQDPTLPLQAVTKQYVDARAGSEVEISASDPIAASPAAELWYDTDDPSGGVITPAFDGTPSAVGVTSTPGTLNNWARGDHVHAASSYTSYNGPPSAVALATAAPGSSTSWARGDHVHSIAPGLVGRNMIHNGQLAVKQRSITTVGLTTTAVFMADRWNMANQGVGACSLTYATLAGFGATALPVGRPKPGNVQYIIMTTAEAAAALSSSDYMQWSQNIEGQFLQHLNWGYADAQPVVYSFDIYSSVATTYVVELYRYEATTRSISKLVTVPVGWSTQVVTFPGDTVGVITNDSTSRLQVGINLVGGSLFTSGGVLQTAWATTVTGNRWVGLSNAIQATVNNVVAITNAQFEAGTVATPYEVRRFDDELRACERYAFFPNAFIPSGYGGNLGIGMAYSATQVIVGGYFPVTMRAAPVLDMGGSTPGQYVVSDRTTSTGCTALAADTSLVSASSSSFTATVTSGLTPNRPMFLYRNANTANLGWSAEI